MAWTYEQRMERAIARLIDNAILDADASEMLHRPKFFAKYAFRLAISPALSSWHNFDELKQELHGALDELGAHIVSVKATYDFYIYANDPKVLRWIESHNSRFFVNSVRQTNPAHWGKALPKQNHDKGKFYGEFRFRVKMRNRTWGTDAENAKALEELGVHHKLVCKKYSNSVDERHPEGVVRDTFVYVDKLNEVLVLKLMFADQVAEVEDRN
ncbi:hypothetical protein D3C87_917800 [compost metagenome]